MVQTVEYAVAFVVTIGVLVFVHELGHFLVARLCGVGVEVFSLGFGPKVVKRTWGRTEYCISAIPLGGYVKMVGESPGAEIAPEDLDCSFTHKSLGRKSLIVAAGPAFNFLLAILIFYLMYQISGMTTFKPVVGNVRENTPARAAGVRAGDIVKEVNGARVKGFHDIIREVRDSGGREVHLVLVREGERLDFRMTPMESEEKDVLGDTVYLLGIESADEIQHHSLGPVTAMALSLDQTWAIVRMTFRALGKMFDNGFARKNLGGPLIIAKAAGEQARAGLNQFVWFIALLSINLGIINLFPIPVLDGGHLLFFGIEALIRRPVSERLREKLIQFGAAILVTLMVFVMYNDIVNIFFNGG